MKSILPYFGFAVMVVDACLMFYTLATLHLYMDLGFAVLYAAHGLASSNITTFVIDHKAFEEKQKRIREKRVKLI